MCPVGCQPSLGILPAGSHQARRPGVDDADGPPVFEEPLLRLQEDEGLEINRVDQVWAADITYIPMAELIVSTPVSEELEAAQCFP